MPKVTSRVTAPPPGTPIDNMATLPPVPLSTDVSPAAEVSRKRNEQLTFELPDGRAITIGPPPMPTQMVLPAMFSSMESSSSLEASFVEILSRAALYVREIDGKPQAVPVNYKDVTAVCMNLQQDGIDAVLMMVAEYFPAVSREQLKVLKK